MKVTKATVKKAIKELGFKVEDFEITSCGSAPRIMTNKFNSEGRVMKSGNAQVKKVVNHLSKQGADYYGTMTGYGAWVYKFETMSHSTRLAFNNID